MKKDVIGYVMMALGLVSFFGGITVLSDGNAFGWGGLAPGAALVGASYVALRTNGASPERPTTEEEQPDTLGS